MQYDDGFDSFRSFDVSGDSVHDKPYFVEARGVNDNSTVNQAHEAFSG